jgi:hypothetical protein
MLAVLHSIGMFLPWLIVLCVRNPRILLLAILANYLVSIQHNVLGRCVLTQFETTDRYPVFHTWLAKQMGLDIREFTRGWTLIMNAAPTLAMGGLLCGVLEKRSRPSSSRRYRS